MSRSPLLLLPFLMGAADAAVILGTGLAAAVLRAGGASAGPPSVRSSQD